MMFETHGVAGFQFAPEAVLSLFANGRMSGLVIDSGYCTTDVTPIFNGFVIPHNVKRNPVGGMTIEDHIKNLLADEGIAVDASKISAMKESECFVSLEP